MKKIIAFVIICLALLASPAIAADGGDLSRCVARAESSPDIAFAEAEAWLKKKGGDKAMLCRAFARFHRGDYSIAAQEFSVLARKFEKKDKKHAANLRAQSGLSFMRAGDHKNSEKEYAKALKLEPQDPDIWMDRAVEYAASERYWDAISDLDKALEIMPDMAEALRLRGQAWARLGQASKAKADFERAAYIEETEK